MLHTGKQKVASACAGCCLVLHIFTLHNSLSFTFVISLCFNLPVHISLSYEILFTITIFHAYILGPYTTIGSAICIDCKNKCDYLEGQTASLL